MSSNLSKIAKAFPKALGQRIVEDLWGLGFRITIRRADNRDFTAWLEQNIDQSQISAAMLKARLAAEREQKDWRKAVSEEELAERVEAHLQLDGIKGASIKEQAPGIRAHLIARDKDGPLAYLDGERLTDGELENLTTISYEDDGSIRRWLPEDQPLGGQAFELAFLVWLFREAHDLKAFEDRQTEGDLGNCDGGRGGITASTSSSPSASSAASESSSTPAPGGAPIGAA